MKRLMGMFVALSMLVSSTVYAESDYNWIEGGTTVDLGNIATVDLDPDFVFLDAEDTKQMALDFGDPVSDTEVGSIYPMAEDETWAVFFDYEETGHIKDDEKEKIDAKALLKSYKEGAKEINKERQPEDHYYVTGWDIEPFYDEQTHNLTWSLLLEDGNKESFLNYNTRLLTREGTISVVLVTDPQNMTAHKQVLDEKILPMLNVKDGNKYTDFDESTDKVAGYGLSALVLGGAGLAVAKKAGLVAVILVFVKKFGVVIIAGLAALWGILRKKKKKPTETIETTEE